MTVNRRMNARASTERLGDARRRVTNAMRHTRDDAVPLPCPTCKQAVPSVKDISVLIE